MSDLVLKNCKLVEKSGEYYIKISNGKIAEISKHPLKAEDEINVQGKFVLPGLIDPHVHFRDPGLTYKESFRTGSLAAANGGFTSVIDMPNTEPPTNTAKNFKEKLKIAEKKSVVDFKLHAGINNLEEIKKIAKLDPASFKIFMDLENDESIENIFKYVSIANEYREHNDKYLSKNPIKITAHCENRDNIVENTIRLKKLECTRGNNALDYSYARPSKAEVISVNYAINLAKKYNVPLHICHLSTKKALELVKSAREPKSNISNLKAKITTEATPHHLLLDNSAFGKYGTITKTNPPLRPLDENITIVDLDKIDMIGTDHAPHLLEEKTKGVWDSSPGIPNLETTLPLLLTEVNKGNIDLKMIPLLMSKQPAKVFEMENKGSITTGNDADLIIVDMKKEGKFNLDNFYTKAEYSPFENCEYEGIATMTLSHGKIIMEDGVVNSS